MMSMQLARLEIRGDRVLVARIDGEVDMSNAADLQRAIVARLSNHAAGLVLDLSGVEYLDSAGIHVIYELREQLEARGLRLRLVVPPDAPTLMALQLTGVPDAVAMHDSVAEAEASIG